MKTMNLSTVLNEGRKVDSSAMNIKGSIIEGKRMREAFEEGQPELDMDMTAAGSVKPNIQGFLDQARAYGASVGDQYGDKLLAMAHKAVETQAKRTGVDMAANAKVYDMEVSDLEMEDDSFFDIAGEICNAFLEGMEEGWPFPIVS